MVIDVIDAYLSDCFSLLMIMVIGDIYIYTVQDV